MAMAAVLWAALSVKPSAALRCGGTGRTLSRIYAHSRVSEDWEPASLASSIAEDAWAEDGAGEEVVRPRRRKRDRADKSPNRLGRPGLKGFVPSTRSVDKVRPTLDDVERISRGQRAKQRGVGSRATPHRLNAEERDEFERAKRRGYLVLQGRGYRKERKGSPLLNIFRQLCDARAKAAVWVEIGSGQPTPRDVCAVDLAPLRAMHINASVIVSSAVRAAAPFMPVGSDPEVVVGAEAPTEEELRTQPIWNVPFHEVRFTATSRPAAKEMALAVVTAVDEVVSAENEPGR